MQRKTLGNTTPFGEFLRAQHEGTSIRELSRRSGVSAGQISRIENGETAKPSRETVRALALALGGHPAPLLILAGYTDERAINDAANETFMTISQLADSSAELIARLDEETGELWSKSVKDLQKLSERDWQKLGESLFEASQEFEAERLVYEHRGDVDALVGVREVAAAWSALTPERQKLVRAFVADQEVLSRLDRLPSDHGRYEFTIDLKLRNEDDD